MIASILGGRVRRIKISGRRRHAWRILREAVRKCVGCVGMAGPFSIGLCQVFVKFLSNCCQAVVMCLSSPCHVLLSVCQVSNFVRLGVLQV